MARIGSLSHYVAQNIASLTGLYIEGGLFLPICCPYGANNHLRAICVNYRSRRDRIWVEKLCIKNKSPVRGEIFCTARCDDDLTRAITVIQNIALLTGLQLCGSV